MSRIKLPCPNLLPTGIDREVITSTVRLVCLLALLGTADHAWAQEGKYTIETNSPASWSDYYMRTGLGTVDAIPLPIELTSPLAGHCRWLTEHTNHDWFPLGYSVELGIKLCYRTGLFSIEEAETYCGRLDLGVMENNRRVIICGGEWGGYKGPSDSLVKSEHN